MEAFGERKGAGTGIVDLEEQLRKQELDTMMFPKDATVGGSSFRGGTRGAKHFLSASVHRKQRTRAPIDRSPSASHAFMLTKQTVEAQEVEMPMARQPVRASTADSFAKRRQARPPLANRSHSERGSSEQPTTHRVQTGSPATPSHGPVGSELTGLTQHSAPGQGLSMRSTGNRAPGSAAGRKKPKAGERGIEGFLMESPRQAVAAVLTNDAANQGRLPPSRRSSKVANWNSVTQRLGSGGSVSDPGLTVVVDEDHHSSSARAPTNSTRLNLRSWGFCSSDLTPSGTPRSQMSGATTSRGRQQPLPMTPPTPPSGPSLRPNSLPTRHHPRADPSYRDDSSPPKRCSTAPAADTTGSLTSSPRQRHRHGGRPGTSGIVPSTTPWTSTQQSPLAAVHEEELSDDGDSLGDIGLLYNSVSGLMGGPPHHQRPVTVFELPLHRVTVAEEVEGLATPSGPAWAKNAQQRGNPFDSVDDCGITTGGGDETARPPLTVRLPTDASSANGTAAVVADLFGLLNDVRAHCETDVSATDAVAAALSPKKANSTSLASSRESSPVRQRPVTDALRGSLLELLMTTKPSGRAHAAMVGEWFDSHSRRLLGSCHQSLSTSGANPPLSARPAGKTTRSSSLPDWLREGDGDTWTGLMQVSGAAMATFIQQVGMHCYERGAGMAQIWNLYTELHDAKVQHLRDKLRISEDGRQRAEAEASQFRSDSGAFYTSRRGMADVVEENATMEARLAFLGSERDDLLLRVMKLEDAAAAADLRNSRLQMLKNWTLKKFVGVTTDKLGLRSREIERLNRDLMMIRMQHEGLNKALPIIADGLNELEDQLKAEPRENPMRIALSMANYGYKQAIDTAKALGQLDDAAQDEDHQGSDMAAALAGNGLDNDSFYDLMKATVDMFDLDLDLDDLEQRLLGDQEVVDPPDQPGQHEDVGDGEESSLSTRIPPSEIGLGGSESMDAGGPTRTGSVAFSDASGAPIGKYSETVDHNKQLAAVSNENETVAAASRDKKQKPATNKRTTNFSSTALVEKSTANGSGGNDSKGGRQLGATLSTISRHFSRSTTLNDGRGLSRASALSLRRSTDVDIDMTDVVEMDHESCRKEVWALEMDDAALRSSGAAARVASTDTAETPAAPLLVDIGSLPSLPRASSRFMGDVASTNSAGMADTDAQLDPPSLPGAAASDDRRAADSEGTATAESSFGDATEVVHPPDQ